MSLFKLIKKTSQENPNGLVSAYKDNVAFVEGPRIEQFYPVNPDRPDMFDVKEIDTVISLKAETHNFPTTVEPFNGAATGTVAPHRRHCRLHDILSPHERRAPLGADVQPPRVALPDTLRYPHQSL